MSGREHIRKKSRSQLNSTSVPNPLQRRRLKAPPQIQSALSQQQSASSIPEQLDRASQFNHNFLDVPVEASQTAQPSPPIQAKVDVGGFGNQEQGEIAIANPGESQEQDFSAEEQTVEQEQISAGEGTENQDAGDSNSDQNISDREQESEVVQRQSETSQAQVEKASRFNHNFLEVPVNTPGAIPTPIQRSVNFSNLGDSYPQEDVSVVDPVKNSLNLFKTQTIQREENVEGEDLEKESETEDELIQKKDISVVDPVKNSLNLFKTQTIQRKESVEGEELEQESETEGELIQKKDVSVVDPVRNSLNLFKAQTIQRKESAEAEELEQESETEGDPVQMKSAKDISFQQRENKPENKERQKLFVPKLTDTVQQHGAIAAKSITQVANKANKLQAKEQITVSETKQVIQRRENPNPEKGAGNQPQPAQAAPVATQPAAPAAPAGGSGATPVAPTVAAVPMAAGGGGAGATQKGTQQATPGGAAGGSAGATGGKTPASPQQDPGFQAAVNKAKGVAQDKKKHDPAQAESKEAQDAAQPPANEVESKAQDQQVQEMNQQQPGTFNAEAFKAKLMEKIAAIIPNNEEDAKKFKESNELDSVKQDVSSQVTEEQKQAAGPIEEKTKEAPNTSGVEAKPVTPMQPPQAGSPPQDIGAEQAAPKPKPDSEISAPLKANSQELNQELAKAKVSEETLEKKSNEPQFVEAVGAKKEAQTHAQEAPQTYRQDEKATINKAQAEAKTTSQTQLEGMHGERSQLLTQVMGAQSETQGKDTQERTKIANEINGIYETTKKEVETVLSNIDEEVTKKFDAGAATAKQIFENHVDKEMAAWEQQRYGEWYDVTGWDERVSDAWNGLPPEVNQFFVDGRQMYLDSMDATLTDIANFVAKKLNDAKQKITEGKQKIQKHVAGLPENLRQVGQEAAQNIQGKFDQLEESVNNKQDELIDSLAQKYSENLQQLDAEIEKKKEENKGLKDKAKDAIVGTVQTIMQLKDMLMGVLAKAAGAIDKIILDPIGFLGNLVSGIKKGFQNFVGNIWEHLKKGLLGWLTGTMAKAGIQMPESFDLKSIFTLVMQVLGFAYDAIKSRTVKALGKNGEKIFNALETTFEIFVILKNEGLAGLWKFIQDKIGDLKVMVIDTIQNFVIESVIKQGVLWVISLLNPASAFVKACKMIYDVIMFFIERGSQIVELVNAVMESVTAIASGAVDGAAKLIENALSTALPVVISFMASLLGLGGISEKIQDIIGKVKEPIDKAIDWLIAQAVTFAKKLGKAIGFGKDDQGKAEDGTDPQKKARLDAAVNEVQQLMVAPGASVKSVEEKLPEIQSKYELKSINLVKEKKGVYHVHATINPTLDGPPGVLFTPEELQELEAVAKDFSLQINQKEKEKPGTKAKFLADPEGFIRAGKVNKSGDVVEAAGTPGIEQLAAEGGLSVVKNAYIQFIDAAGNPIGGRGPELDFLILGSSGVTEIVSAKLKPGEYKPKQDRKLLGHFVNMPLTTPDIVTYTQTNFGNNKAYANIASAKVISNLGEELLGSFRAKYLSKVVVDTITVTSLTPGPEASQGLQLRVTEPQLLAKVVELMKKYL